MILTIFKVSNLKILLKVDGNEKQGGSGGVIVVQVLYAIVAIEGYFKFERVHSL